MALEEQNTNDDGTGAYCFNKNDNKVYQARTMKETETGIASSLRDFDVVNYHFRSSTGGEKGLLNVHFWKIGKWVFAHNGTAPTFQKGKDCDSLGLFKTMLKKHILSQEGYINIKKIKKFISDSTFLGRFILINSETREMYYFGDWHVYLINRSYMVVASSISSFDNKETVEALGISFETDEDVPLEVLESKFDGINTFSFKEGFIQEENSLKEYSLAEEWKKVEEKKGDQKIEEYYAGVNSDYEYFGSNEYQEELNKIEARFTKVYNKVGHNYSKENVKELELAENTREWEIELLDEKYFGAVPMKEVLLLP
jgi:hypothetical protein